jgi:hypothetical protein
MKLLFFSDTHFTDLPRDSYRFKIFPWLHKQQCLHSPDLTLCLGDLTEHKDGHSSILVNSLVEGLKQLRPPVVILRANHDCIDPNMPFFKFLSSIEGITYCTDFTLLNDYEIAMIPHQRTQAEFDTKISQVPKGWGICCHQTFDGAIAETGSRMAGFSGSLIAQKKPRWVYSGDIHKPQVLNFSGVSLAYIGAPWHCRYGDQYIPRVLFRDDDSETDLSFPAPSKLSLTIRDISEMPELKKGDQVKVTLELARSEAVEWKAHKQAVLDHCKNAGVEVYGIDIKLPAPRKRIKLDGNEPASDWGKKSNEDYFQAFCGIEKVPVQIKLAGAKLIGS